MKLGYDIWLFSGHRVFGDGVADLLDEVAAVGSINQAASNLSMSYSKAWRLLEAGEEAAGVELLRRSVGGSCGGGSALTILGVDFLQRYRALEAEAGALLSRAFGRHFDDWSGPMETG